MFATYAPRPGTSDLSIALMTATYATLLTHDRCTRPQQVHLRVLPSSPLEQPNLSADAARGGAQDQLRAIDRGQCGEHLHGRGATAEGLWAENGATYLHHACQLPSFEEAAGRLQQRRRRLLFVGDSTLEEQALLMAHAAGYTLEELRPKSCGNASRYRGLEGEIEPA